jgi:hypothetical protein
MSASQHEQLVKNSGHVFDVWSHSPQLKQEEELEQGISRKGKGMRQGGWKCEQVVGDGLTKGKNIASIFSLLPFSRGR